jgi:hypothetical protein
VLPQKVMLGNEPNQSTILIHNRKTTDVMLDEQLRCLSQTCIGPNCRDDPHTQLIGH